jgi:hypothetical protein
VLTLLKICGLESTLHRFFFRWAVGVCVAVCYISRKRIFASYEQVARNLDGTFS